MNEQPWWQRFDFALYAAVVALCGVGWLTVYSSCGQSLHPGSDAARQAAYLGVGLVGMTMFTILDYRVLGRLAVPLYLLNLALLGLVVLPGLGHSARGAQRWVSLGALGTFQPSELAKFLLILTLARMLSARAERSDDGKVGGPGTLLAALLHVGVPFVVIILQPDLGTALVLVAVMAAMLWIGGLSPFYLLGLGTVGILVAPHVLKPYQRTRLMVFLNPDTDPAGAGYSLIQSKTAIGSGSWWGHGLFHGPMVQHGFVPEHHTDFIFTVVGEELGWVGALGLLALFGCLLGVVMDAAARSQDRFGALVCSGVATMIGFQIFVNVGMTVGLMPVTGIPLPFMSYGGSALLTDLMAVGVVGSVYLRSWRRPRVRDRLLAERVARGFEKVRLARRVR